MSVRKGVFHVIATPIGNLSDITARARDVMAGVDILYAEDTRHTSRLCTHLAINPKLRSLHDHNEDCLLYTSPSPRDATLSRMPSSA